jgi:lipid-binding SYLF domain-containing protein
MRRHLPVLALILATTFLWLRSSPTLVANPPSLHDDLLQEATLAFLYAVDAPASAIPAALMERTRAIAVIPTAMKDGDVHYGMGVVSARNAGAERWTPPAIIAFQGVIPVDLEIDAIDIVLVAVSRTGLDYLSQARVQPQPGIHIPPGPLGDDTAVTMDVDLLAYMRFDGYFAGVTIDRWSITEMKPSNARLYGKPYSSADILKGNGTFAVPVLAEGWRSALASYFRGRS